MARLTRALATTPGRLRALAFGTSLFVAILALIVISTTFEHRHAVHQIGVDDAPSVIAAHNIKVEIEDLDAALLNEMLVPPGERGTWETEFNKSRVEIGRHLLAAIRSAYGGDEDPVLEKLEDGVGHYLMVAQEARDAHVRGDSTAALAAYLESFKILEDELVAPAQQLNKMSDDSLEDSYLHQQHHSDNVRALIWVLAIVVILMIGVTQLHLRQTFRRLVSLPLVGAIVLTMMFARCTLHSLNENEEHLRGLKEDAYDSTDLLLSALADGYEARSAESRALYDGSNRDEHHRRFNDYVSRVTAFDAGGSFATVDKVIADRNARIANLMASGKSALSAAHTSRTETPLRAMRGSLAKALDDIAFANPNNPLDDEPTQSRDTLASFAAFVAGDAKVRELGPSHASEAVTLETKAFTDFDLALSRWIAIDQEWLEHYRDEADEDVKKLEWIAPIFALLIVICIYGGLHPRIKEYGG